MRQGMLCFLLAILETFGSCSGLHVKKFLDKYSETSINWEKVYSVPFRTTLDSKVREFQYKILNNIVFTNDKLFHFGLSQSPNRPF